MDSKSKKLLNGIHTNKDTERIYVSTLTLTPGKNAGLLVIINEDVDEKLYKQIESNIFTGTKHGKVELGYTKNNGVRIRIAGTGFAGPIHLLNQLLHIGEQVTKTGVQDDMKQMNGKREDLSYSFYHMRIILSEDLGKDIYLKSLPTVLSGIQYTILNPFKLSDEENKVVCNTPLVPPNMVADIK